MERKYCKNCGSEIPPEAAYCPFCGHAVSKNGEPDDSYTVVFPKTRGFQSAVLALLSLLSLSVVSFILSLFALAHSKRTKKALTTGEMELAESMSAKSLKILRWGVLFLVLHWLLLACIISVNTQKSDSVGWQSRETPTTQVDFETEGEESEELLEDEANRSLQKQEEEVRERSAEALSGSGEKPERENRKADEETPKQHPTLSKQSPTLSKQSPTLSKQHPTLSAQDLEKQEEASMELKQHEMSSTGGRVRQDGGEKIFDFVEQPPVFPGGGDAAVLKWINSHLRYPEKARENGVQGTVLLRFVVTKTGSVGDVQILKHVDPDLDREAVRVIKGLPKLKPGRHDGEPVNVWIQVPVRFQLW